MITAQGFQLFGELSKVEDQADGSIMVFGVASSGVRDSAGELVTPEAMKAALPDYSLYPALREMHGLSAAGRTVEAGVDDDGITRIVAHVVDPVAIAKVKSKTYAGFSIGGKVLERDKSDRTIITKLKLNEISLVDRPCNPEAAIDLWKADADVENHAMAAAPTNEEVKVEAEAMAKAAGKDGKWKDFVVPAREALVAKAEAGTEAEDIAADQAGDAAAAEAEPAEKAEGEGDLEKVDEPVTHDPAAALAEVLAKAKAAQDAAAPDAPAAPDLKAMAKAALAVATFAEQTAPLYKGLYTVSWLAELMACFTDLQSSMAMEEEWERDGSTLPQKAAEIVAQIAALLVQAAQEEAAEAVQAMGPDISVVIDDVEVMALAAGLVDLVKADADLMEKAGARHSKADLTKVQGIHDHATGLGAMCTADNCPADEADKAQAAEDLTKANAEVERLSKALTEAVPQVEAMAKTIETQGDSLTKALTSIDDLTKRLTQVENEPAAPRTAGSARAITKSEDATGAQAQGETISKADVDGYLASLPDDERSMLLTKAALRLPMRA